jgi:hypothetical protein
MTSNFSLSKQVQNSLLPIVSFAVEQHLDFLQQIQYQYITSPPTPGLTQESDGSSLGCKVHCAGYIDFGHQVSFRTVDTLYFRSLFCPSIVLEGLDNRCLNLHLLIIGCDFSDCIKYQKWGVMRNR